MNSQQHNYEQLVSQISALTAGETDMIANMANISAVIFNGIADVNWAGFYLYKQSQLVLGPFQGNPACIRIPMGRGVCGTAAESRKVQIVDDVSNFSGHISCDGATNSEIVLPIIKNNTLIGVLDLDSPSFSRFNLQDAEYLTRIVDILMSTISVTAFANDPQAAVNTVMLEPTE